MIAGANPNPNNLIANLEILSCEDTPSEVFASILPTGRIWWPRNVLQCLPRPAWQLGNATLHLSAGRARLEIGIRQRLPIDDHVDLFAQTKNPGITAISRYLSAVDTELNVAFKFASACTVAMDPFFNSRSPLATRYRHF